MNKLCLIFGCMLMLAPAAFAQNDRKWDFFVGYSNLQAEGVPDPNAPNQFFDDDFFGRRRGAHGATAALTGYWGSVFGIKGDFSFHQTKDRTDFTNGTDTVKNQVYYFMVGPTLKIRNSSRIEPFVHALAGGAHTRFEVESQRNLTTGTVRNTFDTDSTDFAAAFGGGVDVRLGDRFSIRAFQVDYAPVFLRDRSINVLSAAGALQPFTLEGQRQDNIRLSVGLVF